MVCHGMPLHAKACYIWSWSAMIGNGTPWHAEVRHGMPWHAMACQGLPWFAMVCHCPPRLTMVMECHGTLWHAKASHGMPSQALAPGVAQTLSTLAQHKSRLSCGRLRQPRAVIKRVPAAVARTQALLSEVVRAAETCFCVRDHD